MIQSILRQVKSFIKKMCITSVFITAPLIKRHLWRTWILHHLVPFLLDDKILKNDLTERRMRHFTVPILCNPYVYTHQIPYFFGVMHEIAIENYMRLHVAEGDTVIDVGSNIGHITVLAACLVGPKGHVFSFDPHEEMSKILKKHCEKYLLRQVAVYQMGLSDHSGMARFHIIPGSPCLSTFRIENRGEQVKDFIAKTAVNVYKGDDILSGVNFTGRVFLKIDVEGYEPEVLRGLTNTLYNHVHSAIIEITPSWIGGSTAVESMFSFMKERGFSAYKIEENGHMDTVINPKLVEEQTNVLFIKRPDEVMKKKLTKNKE